MRARRAIGSLAVFGASVVLCVALAETFLRLCLDEVNCLQPTLVRHPSRGFAIAPGDAGHDAWGFRNARIPERVDVIAIGDSQTYGVSAAEDEIWPAWLCLVSRNTRSTTHRSASRSPRSSARDPPVRQRCGRPPERHWLPHPGGGRRATSQRPRRGVGIPSEDFDRPDQRPFGQIGNEQG